MAEPSVIGWILVAAIYFRGPDNYLIVFVYASNNQRQDLVLFIGLNSLSKLSRIG